MSEIKITFCGAARVVTGSCYLLEAGENKFLVDCGLFQGTKELKELNYGLFSFNPADIDFVLLTHAHIDHSGLLPKLYKEGFHGKTYATDGTVDLCSVMLPDCGHIQEMEVERKNRKFMRAGKNLISPIYTAEDAMACARYFEKVDYEQEFSPAQGIRFKFRDAGHILGSAILELWLKEGEKETKFVFSGDLGRTDRPIVKDPTVIEEADFLVMESTYGNRFHENVEDNEKKLREIINKTFQRGGNVVIPAFAVDRTQDLLLTLNKMIEEKEIDPQSVYVDSPLAIAATEIFCKHPQYFDEETTDFMKDSGLCPFLLPQMNFSRTAEESQALNQIKRGAIIISASGMADAGRIKHHLKHNLWRPECSVVFVGYQAQGTLGRKLVEGEKKVRIHGEDIAVNAEVMMLEGYSAHADQTELLNWLRGFKKLPERVFVTHGEEESSLIFAGLIEKEFQTKTVVPSRGETYDLDEIPVESAAAAPQNVFDIYQEINAGLNQLVKSASRDKLKQVQELLKKLSA